MLTLDDFDFTLPPELIAQAPAANRRASRLLRVHGNALIDAQFADLASFLRAGDLLVFNDTRVIQARLWGQKESGGQIEVMVERVADAQHLIAQIRASKSPKAGSRLLLEGTLHFQVEGRCGEQDEFFLLTWLKPPQSDETLFDLLERCGHLPLPPYITHPADAADEARYQTVFARHPGAVAAPTAGLHFDEALLADLVAQGISLAWLTLHVGAGTFQPVRVHHIAEHRMHSERFALPEATVAAIAHTRAIGGRVIAVGTTSLRALEAAAQQGALVAGEAETRIFITPGYSFQVVDALLTNFHLPKSTLLMLVSAFAGSTTIRAAYRHAIAQNYRFFSYGDAMFLERNSHAL